MDLTGLDFATAMSDVGKGLIVKPLLQNYLYDAKFPEFDLHFRKESMERGPDGWFHPSTHPVMHERALYYYLTDSRFPVERKRYMGTIAVMMGKITHEFVQVCLTDAGIRPVGLQRCTTCPSERKCREPGVLDEKLGERGHLDGLLDLSGLSHIPEDQAYPVFEFKTVSNLRSLEDMDSAAYRKRWPEYWAQQQRYQRLSRRRYSVVLFMEPYWPFNMVEIHVPYDLAWNLQVDAKYRSVRQAVADKREPMACCGVKSCPTAALCGVKR